MAKVLGPLIHWPDKADIKRFMPKHFSDVYPDLRATLDCTEFFLQQPRNRSAQHDCWSDYKKHCTVKFLVAIAPDGTITFVSKWYDGRASDRFIVNDSGILDKFDTGDTILTDRGFTIIDLLLSRLISLQIPPASSGWDQYLMKEKKKIAKLRIHVERAIGRIKVFRILNTTLPITLVSLIDDIMVVCAALCNLQDLLVTWKIWFIIFICIM